MIKRMQSALSTIHAIGLAVRELPDALREVVSLARENSNLLDELAQANSILNNGLNLYVEWLDRCIWLNAEIDVERFVANEQWQWAKERICALTDGANELARALESERRNCQQKLDIQWDAIKAIESDRDEALSKLARYEAAETWHQVTDGEGEFPPEGVEVICKLSPTSEPYIGKTCKGYGTFEWRFLSSKDVPR